MLLGDLSPYQESSLALKRLSGSIIEGSIECMVDKMITLLNSERSGWLEVDDGDDG